MNKFAPGSTIFVIMDNTKDLEKKKKESEEKKEKELKKEEEKKKEQEKLNKEAFEKIDKDFEKVKLNPENIKR